MVFFLLALPAAALADKIRIGFFVGDSDAFACSQMIRELNDPALEVEVFTSDDCSASEHKTEKIQRFIKTMDTAVVDIMQSDPADWLLENKTNINPDARLYAVRHSSHGEDFASAGFIFDKQINSYFSHTSSENLKNLVLYIANRDFSINTHPGPPVIPEENSLYHPDADRLFPTMIDYFQWYRESGHFKEGKLWSPLIIFPTSILKSRKHPVDMLIKAYEKNNINTVALMRATGSIEKSLENLLFTPPLKDNLGSVTGFTFKFKSALSSDILSIFKKANVPVFNPQYLFFTPKEIWLDSPAGISPTGISMQFSIPELTGLVEPSVTGGKEEITSPDGKKTGYIYTPAKKEIQMLAKRAARWHRLKTMKNKDKKIVLIYYNHGAGKQNIGASYLNTAESITTIIKQLKKQGYTIKGDVSSESIMDLLIKTGRNIGSWAPGELDRLSASKNIESIHIDTYKQWVKDIDQKFYSQVKAQWGEPETSTIMTTRGNFIFPWVKLGNLTLVPQPSRGWGDDPEKLFHSTTLYPHHQYTAFYLWLSHVLKPDAMISMGTHGTHEWLPGKQAGMTQSCAPEVLIQDIPSLYPYIVDDVGEGIQAKRRGRGVIIDHAVPPFKKGGAYAEYSLMADLISELETTESSAVKTEKFKRIEQLIRKTGIDKDLGLKNIDENSLEAVEHYILALKTDLIPFGLHTFGRSPKGEGAKETALAIAEQSSNSPEFYEEKIAQCGINEINSLMNGLSSGYIEPGSGNDPVRNPESLPTGRNFYAFDPDRVPSREAWLAGKKAGEELIETYKENHENNLPRQVGIILWAVETIRNQGINTATALFLMGMKPVWDKQEKVIDITPVPGRELSRPRIDVLLQMSGLFRDTFPRVALLLDRAVKKAALLTDVQNYIAENSAAVKAELIKNGYSSKDAGTYSTLRIFSARPGSYGTKTAEITASSGLWEDDNAIVDAFTDMVSFGYSKDTWGRDMKPAYQANLKQVDTIVHSISSTLYGTMDNDDMFQYLGGLSMAVSQASGKSPDIFISQQKKKGKGEIESIDKTIGKELRSRYLNPKWIQGMKKEGYAGAREMEKFVEYMWGWQVTAPDAVDSKKWEQTYEVYVQDRHSLDMKKFFNRTNPWAYQSINARMLESIRKDYWHADETTKQTLAKEYAVSVVEKGVACCAHTCNNPLLNQMVVNLISIPGVLPEKTITAFKAGIEKAGGQPLETQVENQKKQIKKISAGFMKKTDQNIDENSEPDRDNRSDSLKSDPLKDVKGYKIKEMEKNNEKTEMTSSGAEWAAALFAVFLICLIAAGAAWKR